MANFQDVATSHADAFSGEDYQNYFEKVNTKLTELGYEVLINDKKNAEFVPSGRLHDAVTQRDNFKVQAANLNKQLEDMKKSAGDNAGLQTQIQGLIDNNSKLLADIEKARVETEIIVEARDAIDPRDLIPFINEDSIKVNAKGEVVGVKEEIERLRKAKPHMFKTATPGKAGSTDPGEPGAGKSSGMNAMIRKVAGRTF